MKTHIIILTDKPISLDVLPFTEERVIHRAQVHPENTSRLYALIEARSLLNELGPDFSLLEKCYVVMEPTRHSIAMLLVIVFGLSQVSVIPDIWIIVNERGEFLGAADFIAEGVDWAQNLYKLRREKEQISKLEKPDEDQISKLPS